MEFFKPLKFHNTNQVFVRYSPVHRTHRLASATSRLPNSSNCIGTCTTIWNLYILNLHLHCSLKAHFIARSISLISNLSRWSAEGIREDWHTGPEVPPRLLLCSIWLTLLVWQQKRKISLSVFVSLYGEEAWHLHEPPAKLWSKIWVQIYGFPPTSANEAWTSTPGSCSADIKLSDSSPFLTLIRV